jgi:hypothetical protein
MTPDAIRCRQLIEALKRAREGDWQEADRHLALEALGGVGEDVKVLSENSGVIQNDMTMSSGGMPRALVTRIEIEPTTILVEQVSVGRNIVTGMRGTLAPARSIMDNLRMFPIGAGMWVDMRLRHPLYVPPFPPSTVPVLCDPIPCRVRIWGCEFS